MSKRRRLSRFPPVSSRLFLLAPVSPRCAFSAREPSRLSRKGLPAVYWSLRQMNIFRKLQNNSRNITKLFFVHCKTIFDNPQQQQKCLNTKINILISLWYFLRQAHFPAVHLCTQCYIADSCYRGRISVIWCREGVPNPETDKTVSWVQQQHWNWDKDFQEFCFNKKQLLFSISDRLAWVPGLLWRHWGGEGGLKSRLWQTGDRARKTRESVPRRAPHNTKGATGCQTIPSKEIYWSWCKNKQV